MARSIPSSPPPRLAAASVASAADSRTVTHTAWSARTRSLCRSCRYDWAARDCRSRTAFGAGTHWLTTETEDTGTAASVSTAASRSSRIPPL